MKFTGKISAGLALLFGFRGMLTRREASVCDTPSLSAGPTRLLLLLHTSRLYTRGRFHDTPDLAIPSLHPRLPFHRFREPDIVPAAIFICSSLQWKRRGPIRFIPIADHGQKGFFLLLLHPSPTPLRSLFDIREDFFFSCRRLLSFQRLGTSRSGKKVIRSPPLLSFALYYCFILNPETNESTSPRLAIISLGPFLSVDVMRPNDTSINTLEPPVGVCKTEKAFTVDTPSPPRRRRRNGATSFLFLLFLAPVAAINFSTQTPEN